MEDITIIDLYNSRDESALEQTTKKYGRYCKTVINNILQSEQDVEECTNDVLLKLWNAIPPAKPSNLKAYIAKIARNLALDRVKFQSAKRRKKGQVELVLEELSECISSQTTTEDEVDLIILKELLNRFLEMQDRDKRNIFIKRYFYVCSISDISKEYNVSELKITSVLFRMRKSLSEYLAKEGIQV